MYGQQELRRQKVDVNRVNNKVTLHLAEFITSVTEAYMCLSAQTLCSSLHMFTRSSATAEIVRVGGHYGVQGHSKSLILISIESQYTRFH